MLIVPRNDRKRRPPCRPGSLVSRTWRPMRLERRGSTNGVPGPRCGLHYKTRRRRRRRPSRRRRWAGPPGTGFARLGARPTSYRLLGGRRPYCAASLILSAAAEVEPSSYDAARQGRQVRRDVRSLLKREEEFCVLPGRAAVRARLLSPIWLSKMSKDLASGRSRRRVVGRRAHLPSNLPSPKTK